MGEACSFSATSAAPVRPSITQPTSCCCCTLPERERERERCSKMSEKFDVDGIDFSPFAFSRKLEIAHLKEPRSGFHDLPNLILQPAQGDSPANSLDFSGSDLEVPLPAVRTCPFVLRQWQMRDWHSCVSGYATFYIGSLVCLVIRVDFVHFLHFWLFVRASVRRPVWQPGH